MDARQLAVLRELGDRGSVTAVAQALLITPSAVSQQLAALQRGVPVPLTRRRGRTLVLTEAGQALAAAATGVAAALAHAHTAVDAFLADPAATVRVAAFSSAAAAFFPALLSVAASGGPAIECVEHDVAQARFPALCADHDIVIAHRLDHSPPWPTAVVITPLLHEPLDVAVPTGHPLAEEELLSVAQVSAQPWIAVHDGFPLLAPLEAIAAVAGRPLNITHRINDLNVAASLVAAGAGIALMPRYTGPARPDVVLRPLAGMNLGRHIDALLRPERALRTSVTRTLTALSDTAEQIRTPATAPLAADSRAQHP